MVACFNEDGIELGTPSTFIKYFSDGYDNEAVALEETSDGGFIMLMNSTIQDSEAQTPRNKACLIKTDQYGTELWRHYFPPINLDTPRWIAHSLTLVENGGYLVMGESINAQTGSSNMLAFKAFVDENNPTNVTLTSKVFKPTGPSDPFNYSTIGEAATIKVVDPTDPTNGNYLFVASSENPTGKMVVGELNSSDLSIDWSISRGEDAISILTNRLFFNLNGDNLIYWGGTVTKTLGEKSDIRFTENPINTIPSGDNNIGNAAYAEAANDMCLSGNIFCFVGSIDKTGNNKDIYFLRGTSGADTVVYRSQFVSGTFINDKNEEANSVSTTKDGGFIILATIDTYTGIIGRGNTDLLLMKVNAFGDYQWSVNYGSLDADFGKAVRQTTDGGYIALGTARLAGTRTLMVIKTDKTGDVD